MDDRDVEIRYRKLFGNLRTRKKFTIGSIEGTQITIAQDEEICGQKEPRMFVLNSVKELDKFITEENQTEREIENQLSGNKMPYR